MTSLGRSDMIPILLALALPIDVVNAILIVVLLPFVLIILRICVPLVILRIATPLIIPMFSRLFDEMLRRVIVPLRHLPIDPEARSLRAKSTRIQ